MGERLNDVSINAIHQTSSWPTGWLVQYARLGPRKEALTLVRRWSNYACGVKPFAVAADHDVFKNGFLFGKWRNAATFRPVEISMFSSTKRFSIGEVVN
jgi:hypothetical protein